MKILLFTLLTSIVLIVACNSGKKADCEAPIFEGDAVTAEQIKCKLDMELPPSSLRDLDFEYDFLGKLTVIGIKNSETSQEEKDWIEYAEKRGSELQGYQGFEFLIEDKVTDLDSYYRESSGTAFVTFGERVICEIQHDDVKRFWEQYNLPSDAFDWRSKYGDDSPNIWPKQNKDVLVTLVARYYLTRLTTEVDKTYSSGKDIEMSILFSCKMPEIPEIPHIK